MIVVSLGGSNSVMSFGLRSGLKSKNKINLIELAVGATSSLQNLYALIKNKNLIENANLIITESNVNDSYNIKNMNLPLEMALENIDRFYHELSHTQCRVCVILIPLNFNKFVIESQEIKTKVNFRHLQNIKKFGFDFIDLEEYVKKQLKSSQLLKKINMKKAYNHIIPDPRHPKIDLMHDLGENVIEYYSKIDLPSGYKHTENYSILLSKHINKNVETKSNSKFISDVLSVDKKYYFPKEYIGHKLLGIATWGKGCLKISSEKISIIKNFNDLYAVNEIIEDVVIDQESYFQNSLEQPTEKSVNTPFKRYIEGKVQLEAFLFTTSKIERLYNNKFFITKRESINLDFIVPDLSRYVVDSEQSFENFRESLIHDQNIDLFRESAILLEKIDINKAYELMLIAKSLRPKGPTICKKILEYEKNIADNKQKYIN